MTPIRKDYDDGHCSPMLICEYLKQEINQVSNYKRRGSISDYHENK